MGYKNKDKKSQPRSRPTKPPSTFEVGEGSRSQPEPPIAGVSGDDDETIFFRFAGKVREALDVDAKAALGSLRITLENAQRSSPAFLGGLEELFCMVLHHSKSKVASGHASKAMKYYKDDYSRIKVVETFLVLGGLLLEANDLENAEKLCRAGLAKFPLDTPLLDLKTRIEVALKAYEDAQKAYDDLMDEETTQKLPKNIVDKRTDEGIDKGTDEGTDKGTDKGTDEGTDEGIDRSEDLPEAGEESQLLQAGGYTLNYNALTGRGSMCHDGVSISTRLVHIELDNMKLFDMYRGICSSHNGLLTIVHVMKDPKTETYSAIADDYYTFAEYLAQLKQQFLELYPDESEKAWGKFIAPKVRQIFGEVAETLISLYDYGSETFDNLHMLAISMTGKPRIQLSTGQESEPVNDVTRFFHLMRQMLFGHFKPENGYDVFDFPLELKHLLSFSTKYKDSLAAKYVLHHPFFWTISLKEMYPSRLIKALDSAGGTTLSSLNSAFKAIDKNKKFKNWKSKLYGVYYAIWAYGDPEKKISVEQSIEAEEELGAVIVAKYFNTVSIVRYFANTFSHINDIKFKSYRLKEKYLVSEVLADLTRLYPYFYTQLYESAAEYIRNGSSSANWDGLFGFEMKDDAFPEL